MITNALSILLTMVLMLAVGVAARHFGITDAKAESLISNLIVKICLPALVVSNIFAYYTKDSLFSSLLYFAVPALAMLAGFAVSLLARRLGRVPEGKQGQFSSMFYLSNSVFIGLPVCTAIFGEEAVPYALFYYLANTLLFWTLGYQGIALDAAFCKGEKPPAFSPQSLKKLLSPPLVTLALCLILLYFGFQPPAFFLKATAYLGGAVTPLSMLFIGAVLYSVFRQGFVWDNSFWLILLGRFVVSPLLAFLCGKLLGAGGIALGVIVMQSAMPVMTQASIVSNLVGADDRYPASATVLTTLAGFASIPLYTVWISSWL